MNILILGGDGFCGWPTALRLSFKGHDVTIVDNGSRRRIASALGAESLTPILSLRRRVEAWEYVSGKRVGVVDSDIARHYDALLEVVKVVEPDTIIHMAEQRAAPFSMKNPRNKRYTVDNNINATHNVLCAIVESCRDIHLVHIGTMGVYGYGTAGEALPEGYTTMWSDPYGGGKMEFRYPPNPGSVYHMTKVLDAEMFAYYAKNDRLRITDLHQGIIWGTHTTETKLDVRLINRFDYDGDYGTVLNRFIVEAAVGHPITVHGTGGQTRAFIHIQNSVECIDLAVNNPPERGERVKIFNQVTETHRIRDLAQMVSEMTQVPIRPMENPRNEASENELIVRNDQFLGLGLQPIFLSDGLVEEIYAVASEYAPRVDLTKIPATSRWTRR